MNKPLALRLFFFPVLVFTVHIAAIVFCDVYGRWPWFDIPMHFLGGASIGTSSFFLLEEWQKKRMVRISHSVLRLFIAAALTVTIAVLWEFYEFLLDFFFRTQSQTSLRDTMSDLFLGMCGGTLATSLLLLRAKK